MAVREIYSDVAIVIPTFNEGTELLKTLDQVGEYFENIYVVDDGSNEKPVDQSRNSHINYLFHPVNLGQGAALQTGITAALKNSKVEFIITFDADGQHNVLDAIDLVKKIRNSRYDIVLGSRFIKGSNISKVPIAKTFILKLGVIFTRFDSGLKVTDTHNGLRIMTRKFAKNLKIRQCGMAHASEILNYINNSKALWCEIPVSINYNLENKKKNQSILNSINIVTELFLK